MIRSDFIPEAQKRGLIAADGKTVLNRLELTHLRAHLGLSWQDLADTLGVPLEEVYGYASDHQTVAAGPHGSGIAGSPGQQAPGFDTAPPYGPTVTDPISPAGPWTAERKRQDFIGWMDRTLFKSTDLIILYWSVQNGHLPYTYAEIERWLGLEPGAIKAEFAARGGTPNDLP